jgi:hypothetical protein
MATHKAMAVLNSRLHTEADLRAYQECYLGLALLYVLLLMLVWELHRRYTLPGYAGSSGGETSSRHCDDATS